MTSSEQNANFIIDCNILHSHFENGVFDVTAHPYSEADLFATQSALCSEDLPFFIRQKLLDFYRNGNDEGVLLLKNLPQDKNIDTIPTPETNSVKKTYISELFLAIIGARLGHLFGYRQIANGMLFHNIVPKRGMEKEQSYAGSKVELMFHTEQHFHPYSPDYILLYCLRSESDTETFFASIRNFDTLLDKNSRKLLFEPIYKTGIDHVFGNSETEQGNGPLMPVLYGHHKDPYLRYDIDLMIGTTSEARSALKSLQIAIKQVKKSVCLQAGDLLIIDNRRTLHGRSPFTPKFDGKDRWLQRTKVIRDIDKAITECNHSKRIVESTSF